MIIKTLKILYKRNERKRRMRFLKVKEIMLKDLY